MKSYTAIIAAAAMLQGAMAQGVEKRAPLGPNLADDVARKVGEGVFANACRQNSVGQIIDGKTLPFPCNAEVQIKDRCDQMAETVEEMKECLCRKNTDKQPSAFFEVAQACVSCYRCNRLQTISGADYYRELFNTVEKEFCSPENTDTYAAIYSKTDKGMPMTNEFDEDKTCVGKSEVNILDYAKPEIQPWGAGGRFAKGAKAPEAPAGRNGTNGTTDGNKGSDQEPAALKPVPVADQVMPVCANVTKASEGGASPKFSNDTADRDHKSPVPVCLPLVGSGCTAVVGGLTCSKMAVRYDLTNFQPSEMSIKWSLDFTYLIPAGALPGCEPLPHPEKLEGNVFRDTNILAPNPLAKYYANIALSFNTQIDITFQQCGVCEEAAKQFKEAPERSKIAPAQPPVQPPAASAPAPSTPNKQSSAQPEEEDLSCEVEDEPAGSQSSQPPITKNINLENKINIAGPSGPGNDGTAPSPGRPCNDGTVPNPPSKGIAPGPEPQEEGGPVVSRPERSASDGETPDKPMPSGVTPSGAPGNDGVAPAAPQGKPGVSVSTETTTTKSRNGTATTPSCKGPSCAVMVNGAGAYRASAVMAAAAAVLVAAL